MKYIIGKGNWIESVIAGSICGIILIIMAPFLIIIGINCFIFGFFGFIKKEE